MLSTICYNVQATSGQLFLKQKGKKQPQHSWSVVQVNHALEMPSRNRNETASLRIRLHIWERGERVGC